LRIDHAAETVSAKIRDNSLILLAAASGEFRCAGSYSVVPLIQRHGRDGNLTDWLSTITAECAKKRGVDMSDHSAPHGAGTCRGCRTVAISAA
jgi:hypothetical protein